MRSFTYLTDFVRKFRIRSSNTKFTKFTKFLDPPTIAKEIRQGLLQTTDRLGQLAEIKLAEYFLLLKFKLTEIDKITEKKPNCMK